MMFLDVVYNHFGPAGNYLHAYAKIVLHRAPPDALGRRHQFRRARRRGRCATSSSTTRCTGSRNITSTACASTPSMRSSTTAEQHIIAEIAERARAALPGRRDPSRARERRERGALARARAGRARRGSIRRNGTTTSIIAGTCSLTGEADGYYEDLRRRSRSSGSARCLAEGFAYQGEPFAPRGRRAARRDARRICRPPPSSPSCRTTTRSATAPSASASPNSRPRSVSRSPGPASCSRRRFRCSTWARNGRPRRRSCSSSISPTIPSCRKRCATGGDASSRTSRRFAEQHGERDIPDPTAEETFRRSRARLVRGRALAARRGAGRGAPALAAAAGRGRTTDAQRISAAPRTPFRHRACST